MGVRNDNSTSYEHPDEPNLLNLHKAMQYNTSGEPVIRTHVDGINLTTGDVIVDAVKLWDGTHTLSFDQPNNDGEAGQYSLPAESYNMVYNGSTWDRMRGNIANGVLVDVSNWPTTQTISGNVNANVSGNVGITGNISGITSMPPITGNVGITGNISGITSLPSITGNVNANVSGNVGITGNISGITSMPPITGNVGITGNISGITSLPAITGTVTANVTSLPSITGNVNANVSGNVSITGNVNIGTMPEVEIKNDINNPIPVSKDTNINSATNRIYVSQETDVVLADSNYEFNVARGLIPGQYNEMKNGYAPSMASTGEATVWGLSTLYPWSAWTGTGSRLWVASSSASDVGQTVYIDGLDSNFARINDTVTLNGTTAVQTTRTFYRINRIYILTGNANAGNISVRVTSSSGTEVGYMIVGNSRGKSGIFTIPAGYTAYILYGDASSYKNGSGNVSGQVDMFTRTNIAGVTTPFMNQFAAVVANGQYRNEFNVPLAIPEKTDIDVRFLPSGNATTVSVNWEMILIPNT